MSVIGHEYTHAISNRMVAGPTAGLSGSQAGAMGESWSDLTAVEQLHEYGLVPLADENPFAVGPYATGDKQAGIRNYGMNVSPLNYSDVGYDFACNAVQNNPCPQPTQVHADGEIWSATNFDIREAMNARYDGAYPVFRRRAPARLRGRSDARRTVPWQPALDPARVRRVAADGVRKREHGRRPQRDAGRRPASLRRRQSGLLWDVFARQGLGEFAASTSTNDVDPRPSFESPHADEGTLVFTPLDGDGNPIPNARLFVGRYEARVTPVADTDPSTDARQRGAPGPRHVRPHRAGARGTATSGTRSGYAANQVKEYTAGPLFPNLASSARGATASGDGINIDKLIDDTEATNWASLGSPIAGKKVTVRLDPSKPVHNIRRIQVSAMLRTPIANDPGGDTAAQSRFSALRQFELLACRAQGTTTCTADADFKVVFRSSPNAFEAVAPRPRAPDLIMRSFNTPRIRATHVQLRVVTNQCTGTPAYAGDQDDDPLNITDCSAGSTQDDNVRAAELQVFSQ